MKLLVRRYVCDEQRKRDDVGITEDDIMEVRQDISTLRYELIDIFNRNGMKTPKVNKDDAAGRVMNVNVCDLLYLHTRTTFSFRQERQNDGASHFEGLSDWNC